MTATRDDEKVAALLDRLGYEGYGLWWAVLETIAGSIGKGSEKCSLRYPVSKWAAALQLHPPNVCRQLAALCAEGLLVMSRDDAGIELTVPNLLKYRDEYTQRSGHSHDSIQTKKQRQNTDTEKEETKEPPKAGLPVWNKAAGTEKFRTGFWIGGVVWQKVAYGAALKSWLKKATSEAVSEAIIQAAKTQGPGIIQEAITNGHSVLHPSTWLNQERWKDEPRLCLAVSSGRPSDRFEMHQKRVSETFDALMGERISDGAEV